MIRIDRIILLCVLKSTFTLLLAVKFIRLRGRFQHMRLKKFQMTTETATVVHFQVVGYQETSVFLKDHVVVVNIDDGGIEGFKFSDSYGLITCTCIIVFINKYRTTLDTFSNRVIS